LSIICLPYLSDFIQFGLKPIESLIKVTHHPVQPIINLAPRDVLATHQSDF